MGYTVWGADQTPYGPVELATLIAWVRDERVTAGSWIFDGQTGVWQKAAAMPELQPYFQAGSGAEAERRTIAAATGIDFRGLRQVKILGGMTDEQLEHFSHFVTVEKIPQWTIIIRQGEREETLYLILEGEVRVRIEVLGKETVLGTLRAGDFFGDLALLDRGPRSADVEAATDCILVKLPGDTFDQLIKEAPDLAAPLLHGLDQTLTARIRQDNKRYSDLLSPHHARP